MSSEFATAQPIPVLVLGGSGYVAGEALRLLLAHPRFAIAGVLSDSQAGEPIGKAFPHLAALLADRTFAARSEIERLVATLPACGIVAAAPHGVSAALIDGLLRHAAAAGTAPRVVDVSADFRHRDPAAYAKIYQHEHAAPQRLAEFTCAVPEHLAAAPTPHIAHPGCFATTTLLAVGPLLALDLVEPTLFVAAVTGSTGSGRKPIDGTHHPLRHSDLYAYNALNHRHIPEIQACAQALSGVAAEIAFVAHSGPFARGIHATVQARLKRALDSAQLLGALREFYAGQPFVRVLDTPPRVKDIVASNYAHLSAAANGRTAVVMSVADNLTKGAAGGAIQWLNRLFGLPETTGLTAPAAGWT
ncbi:MAG: N-acetyl-gamma-glutamyl-phosphate reductase [Steroidobacteraceae bacterium]|nr:N-acetyl-gamma-glutamyl-phosphate reductase [Steroidobacteraceae bacterium]MDW8258683.1 N-acetyl-gamma-glutamyl-phosphate reductase [Gammaproteobacteria bacterium]